MIAKLNMYAFQDGAQEIQGRSDYHKLQKQFEEWLRSENGKLTKILIRKESLSSKELKSRQQGLKVGFCIKGTSANHM